MVIHNQKLPKADPNTCNAIQCQGLSSHLAPNSRGSICCKISIATASLNCSTLVIKHGDVIATLAAMPSTISYAAVERRTDLAAALEALCIDVDELVAADDVVDDEKEQRNWRYERGDNTEGEAQQHGHEVVGDLVAIVDVLPHPQPRTRPLPSGPERAHPEHQQLCTHAQPFG